MFHPLAFVVGCTPLVLGWSTPALAAISAPQGLGWVRDTSFAPRISGHAVYTDVDNSHSLTSGDRLVVRFDRAVSVLQSNPSAFLLPVAGDALGSGASLVAGPDADQVTIVLGAGAVVRTRQTFNGSILSAGSASGIEINPSIPTGVLVDATHGVDAIFTVAVDVVPGFTPSSNVLDSAATRGAIFADADGDGALDLFAQKDGAGLKLWFNDGFGNFNYFGHNVGGTNIGTFTVADFDKDGDPDVAAGSTTGGSIFVYHNAGFGNFSPPINGGGAALHELQAGDVNGDGWEDVVSATGTGCGITLNSNGGTFFQAIAGFGLTQLAHSVALGDVDRDGDLDAVLGSQGANSRAYLNNGQAQFTWTGQELGLGTVVQVRLGDVDGDGTLDLCKFIRDQGIEIWGGGGDGTFNLILTAAAGESVRKGLLSDYDADGDLDIVYANNSSGMRVLLQGPALNFTALDENHGRTAAAWISSGDVDKDGDADFIVGSDNRVNRIWLNSMSGSTGTAAWIEDTPTLVSEPSNLIAAGDIDGDGDVDFVSAVENKPSRVLRNDGTGHFSSIQTLGPAENTRAISLDDLDGDGDLDCAAGTWNTTQPNRVWMNDGTGTFTLGQLIYGERTSGLVMADFDGDGDKDMVTMNDGTSRVRFNNGEGVFYYTGISLGPFFGVNGVPGDIDGDGDLDLVVTGNTGGTSVRVYFNLGAGFLVDSNQTLDPGDHGSVQLADFDADGDLDLVDGNVNAGARPFVYFNDGLGIFTNTGQVFPNQQTESIAVGDVDRDGDVDIVFGNNSSLGVPNQVWLNDGLGQFSDSGLALGNYKTSCVLLTDVDRDGDLDILEAVNNSAPVRVWFHK